MMTALPSNNQQLIQFFFIFNYAGVYCAPSDFLDGNSDKLNAIGDASSLNSDVQPNDAPEQPKYSCSIFDSILTKNCSDEADYYLDEARKACCSTIVVNNCKIRLLKQVCSEEDYVKKLSSLNANSDFAWEETPECPKNYDKSYCDISAIESLTGLPPNWVRNLLVCYTDRFCCFFI